MNNVFPYYIMFSCARKVFHCCFAWLNVINVDQNCDPESRVTAFTLNIGTA